MPGECARNPVDGLDLSAEVKEGNVSSKRLAVIACALCLVMAGMAVGPISEAQGQRSMAQRQIVTGTVIGIGGRLAGRSAPFRLTINDFTSPGDVERLNAALRSGGQDEVLDILSRMDAGRIAIGNNVGVTANAIIRTHTAEGGSRIIALYRREVSIFELRYGARSQDYKFGYAEIFLDARGRGEGTFIPAARLRLGDGDTWEVVDFGEFPARIMGVRSTGNVPAR